MHEDKMRLHGGKRGLVISSAGKPQFHSCIIKVQIVGRRKKMYWHESTNTCHQHICTISSCFLISFRFFYPPPEKSGCQPWVFWKGTNIRSADEEDEGRLHPLLKASWEIHQREPWRHLPPPRLSLSLGSTLIRRAAAFYSLYIIFSSQPEDIDQKSGIWGNPNLIFVKTSRQPS